MIYKFTCTAVSIFFTHFQKRNLYISTTDSDGTQPVVTESSSRPSVSVTCMSRSQLLDSDEGVSIAVVLVRLRLLV